MGISFQLKFSGHFATMLPSWQHTWLFKNQDCWSTNCMHSTLFLTVSKTAVMATTFSFWMRPVELAKSSSLSCFWLSCARLAKLFGCCIGWYSSYVTSRWPNCSKYLHASSDVT
ncbi:unnamed protein product [Dibothriocephalus latus]|uniref:Uncharacterized protein n=1 Tax=Dibothriocephalus latus TaxID=60516 RepID=A0A3P7S447_DIBLA|nr:unnamed protein product [Dibothriocephalus latus]